MQHIVWDWNGTLLDDRYLVVEALNAVLRAFERPEVDLATYQRLYSRPVKAFYERLLGRAIAPDEWQHIDETYHAGYRAALAGAQLALDAEAALDAVTEDGRTQSLLSMYPHDELVPLVRRMGIDDRFVRIDGLRGPGGGVKAPHLEAHLERVLHATGDDPARVLVVGDALDDAAAAAHVGAACVLYDGGSHARDELERAGVPVADSLSHALELAGRS